DAAERGDDLLAHRGAFATAFNDLEIGAAAGGLLAEIHGAEPWERLMRGPHTIAKKTMKVKRNQKRRGTTISRNLRFGLTISMTYDAQGAGSVEDRSDLCRRFGRHHGDLGARNRLRRLHGIGRRHPGLDHSRLHPLSR